MTLRKAKIVVFCFILSVGTLHPVWDDESPSNDLEHDPLLITLRTDPININSATRKELEQLPWLNNKQIIKILDHLKTESFNNMEELISFGIDEIDALEMENYVYFGKRIELTFRNTLRCQLYRANIDQRSSLKAYSKSEFKWNNLQAGFISEKDQGENNVLDFYSYYLSWQNENWLEQFIIGKYQLYNGLGLILNSKLGNSKSIASAGNILRIRSTLRPYRSAYEIWALEGCCAELRFGKFQFIPFYSNSALSANLEAGKITSFNATGLHFDPTEKDNVREKMYGILAGFEAAQNSFGLGFLQQEFDHEFAEQHHQNSIRAISLNFTIESWFFPLIGELAWSNGSISGLIGFSSQSKKLRQQVIYRRYDKYFPDWHGNALSASGSFPNEEGIYYGLSCNLRTGIKFYFYFDQWKIPETAYFEKMPVTGREVMFHFNIKLPDKNLIKLQINLKNKEKYITLNEGRIRDLQKIKSRLDWQKHIRKLIFRSRFEYTEEYLPEEKSIKQGWLFSQLIKYNTENWKAALQLTSFANDVLQYIYEYGVDGTLSNSVLSGNDIYYNLFLSFLPVQNLKLQTSLSGQIGNKDKLKMNFQVITEF